MEFKDLLQARRSVRKFEEREVEQSVISHILTETLTAPSSRNTRSTRFVVVRGSENMEKLSQMRDYGSGFAKDAPCAILVCGDTSQTDLWLDNAAISATLMQLSATNAGLGSCWVHVNERPHRKDEPEGLSAEGYLRSFMEFSEEWKPLCFIVLGYQSGTVAPHHTHEDKDKVIWL